jgi:hypothetical protein
MEDWISSNDTMVLDTMARFMTLVCGEASEGCDNATRIAAPTVFLAHQKELMAHEWDHVTHLATGQVSSHAPTHRPVAAGRPGACTATKSVLRRPGRWLQEDHAAMVAQLKADPVLGPLLSYCRCILTHNDVHVYDVCCFGREDGRCPEHSRAKNRGRKIVPLMHSSRYWSRVLG